MYRRYPIQNQPWLVIGDFNEILESSEKCGAIALLIGGLICLEIF